MRILTLCCIFLAGAAGAQEPDGAVAPATRWTGPWGCASGSLKSHAFPVVRDVEEAWAAELPGRIVAPPVHWHGTAYALCADERSRHLAAVQIADGQVLGRQRLEAGPEGPLLVWDDVVVAPARSNQLGGWRLSGSSFIQVWRFRPAGPAGADFDPTRAVLHESEVYATSGGTLYALLLHQERPLWTAEGTGWPVVYGDFVVVFTPGGGIAAYRRGTGTGAARVELDERAAGPGRDAEITIGGGQALVRLPRSVPVVGGGRRTHAFLDIEVDDDGIFLRSPKGYVSSMVTPSIYEDGFLALDPRDGGTWLWWREGRGAQVATAKTHPDLFGQPVPATVLRDIVYFGTWGADLRTHEILWRLPMESTSHPAVPADGLVLVADGSTLRAFRGRRTF